MNPSHILSLAPGGAAAGDDLMTEAISLKLGGFGAMPGVPMTAGLNVLDPLANIVMTDLRDLPGGGL